MPPRLPSRNMTLPQDVDDYLFSLQHGTVSRTVAEAVRETEGYKAWKAAIQASPGYPEWGEVLMHYKDWKAMQEDE